MCAHEFNRDLEAPDALMYYEVREGPRVLFERIDIGGNVAHAGQGHSQGSSPGRWANAFNTGYSCDATRQELSDLGFFSRVDCETQSGPVRPIAPLSVLTCRSSHG